MVAMVERLDPFEVQERKTIDLSVVGLYDILPSNASLLVAIDRGRRLRKEKNRSFEHLSVDLSYRF